MSEETKQNDQIEEETPVKKRVTRLKSVESKKPRKGAGTIDLIGSANAFKEDFYVLMVRFDVNEEDYADKIDENGEVDPFELDPEQTIQFQCRYIDPGTLNEITNTSMIIEPPANIKDLPPQEALDKLLRLHAQAKTDKNREFNIQSQVVYSCTLDPQFESVDQVKSILPVFVIEDLFYRITEHAIGSNLLYRFPGSDRK